MLSFVLLIRVPVNLRIQSPLLKERAEGEVLNYAKLRIVE